MKALPGTAKDEAAALDDLGSLYRDMGQPEMSKKVRLRVLQIFQAEDDHAGVARVHNNLAAIALQQTKMSEARRHLDQAFVEIKLSPQANPADLAAMFSNAGWISFHRHDYHEALEAFERALQLWLQLHGADHELTGWGYVLRGRAHMALGDTQQALEDVRKGTAIVEKTADARGQMYLSARLAYADVLNAAGSTKAAKAVRVETLHLLDSLRRSQSSAYVLNTEAFRR